MTVDRISAFSFWFVFFFFFSLNENSILKMNYVERYIYGMILEWLKSGRIGLRTARKSFYIVL